MNNAYYELISKCWEDKTLKEAFFANPAKVLNENGIEVNPDVEYRIIEAAPNELYYILPTIGIDEQVQAICSKLLTMTKANNISIPQDTKLILMQNTEKLHYLVYRDEPKALNELELDMVVGGKGGDKDKPDLDDIPNNMREGMLRR